MTTVLCIHHTNRFCRYFTLIWTGRFHRNFVLTKDSKNLYSWTYSNQIYEKLRFFFPFEKNADDSHKDAQNWSASFLYLNGKVCHVPCFSPHVRLPNDAEADVDGRNKHEPASRPRVRRRAIRPRRRRVRPIDGVLGVVAADHERRPEVNAAPELCAHGFPGPAPVKVVQHDATDGVCRRAVEQEPRLELDVAPVRGVLAAQLDPLVFELAELARILDAVRLRKRKHGRTMMIKTTSYTKRHVDHRLITYYWTVPLILDHFWEINKFDENCRFKSVRILEVL